MHQRGSVKPEEVHKKFFVRKHTSALGLSMKSTALGITSSSANLIVPASVMTINGSHLRRKSLMGPGFCLLSFSRVAGENFPKSLDMSLDTGPPPCVAGPCPLLWASAFPSSARRLVTDGEFGAPLDGGFGCCFARSRNAGLGIALLPLITSRSTYE